ncbi:MAG: hypothetical protein OXC40_04335 [Proteobacteria bacterium]|nr:hypothetical protein [Pseudomonadota bacterium]
MIVDIDDLRYDLKEIANILQSVVIDMGDSNERAQARWEKTEKNHKQVLEQIAEDKIRIKQAEDAGLIVISAFGGDSFSLSQCMNKFNFQPKIFQLPEGTDNR